VLRVQRKKHRPGIEAVFLFSAALFAGGIAAATAWLLRARLLSAAQACCYCPLPL